MTEYLFAPNEIYVVYRMLCARHKGNPIKTRDAAHRLATLAKDGESRAFWLVIEARAERRRIDLQSGRPCEGCPGSSK